MPCTIVIADDSAVVRRELRSLVETIPGARVVATAADGGEALRAVARHRPDLLMLDIRMPGGSGFDVLSALGREGAPVVLMVSNGSGPAMRARALAAGAAGCFDKSMDMAELLEDIRSRVDAHTPGTGEWMTEWNLAGGTLPADMVQAVRDEQLDALARNIPDIIARFDRELRFTYVNPAAVAASDVEPGAFIGRTPHELGFAETAANHWGVAIRGVFANARPDSIDFCYPAPDGERWFQSRIVPEWVGGGVGSVLTVTRDITAQRQAEITTRESDIRNRFQASLLDAVGEAVMATDLTGTITYWNRAAERLYGWTAAEACGRSVVEIIPTAPAAPEARVIMKQLVQGLSWSGEFEVQRRDGTSFVAFVTDSPITDEHGLLVGIVGISSDLTTRRKLEAELRQAQKMEAVGRLAGGVAHDFNNILTSISGFTGFLLDGLASNSPLRSDALEIHSAAERATSLTRQLLTFSRKRAVETQVFPLCPVVTGLEGMLRRLIGEDIRLTLRCEDGCGHVHGDPGSMEQVVANLVVNAVDAVGPGGEIIIELGDVTVDAAQAERGSVPVGEYVLLAVRDTGCGMNADVVRQMFEPFFTTKPSGKGTGLGLSTVHGIVTQAGGFIDVDSAPGAGSTFRVYLPRVGAPAVPGVREVATPVAPPRRGHETILLVEDDDAVRRIAHRSLEKAGYTVIQAAAPSEALGLIRSNGHRPVDLLLTDVVLPEMNGPLLARQVRFHVPAVQVLLMSGYLPDDILDRVEESALDHEASILTKPFTMSALLAKVRDVLDRAAA